MTAAIRSYADRVVVPSAYYSHVKRAWDAGHDSYDIAQGLRISEADVCRVLAKFRRDRPAQRKKSA